jgi:hypothetical protein
MPTSNINNINIVNTVNALIAGLPNAATMEEAINLLNESEVLIHNLPHSERTALREARSQVWLQTFSRLQQAPRQSRATMNAIDRANVLIDNMSRATTYNEAIRYMDDLTIVINSLPRNGNAYRRLADRQWATWLQAYDRTAVPIQSRAPITVNGITTTAYDRNRNRAPITVNGITSDEYNRLTR